MFQISQWLYLLLLEQFGIQHIDLWNLDFVFIESISRYLTEGRGIFTAVLIRQGGMASHAGKVLVYGGKGALGSNIVKYFCSKHWVSFTC